MDVLIDCSLSNAVGPVCVDVEGKYVAIDPSGEYSVVGTYHPDGELAANVWLLKHADLLNDLVRRIEKTDDPHHEAAVASVIEQVEEGASTDIEETTPADGAADTDTGEDSDEDDDQTLS